MAKVTIVEDTHNTYHFPHENVKFIKETNMGHVIVKFMDGTEIDLNYAKIVEVKE